MFWRFGGYANISAIDSLLDKDGVTLEEVLDESELMSELKQHHTKLVEYLRSDENMKKMLDYVVSPSLVESQDDDDDNEGVKTGNIPSKEDAPIESTRQETSAEEDESVMQGNSTNSNWEAESLENTERARLRYAYISCEILSSSSWSIIEAMMSRDDYLRDFWHFLWRKAPLDPLQSGYFTKVNEILLEKKTAEMLGLIKSMDGVVQTMLRHIDNPMIMDLLIKIISLDRVEGGQGIVEWLQSQNLIPSLLGFLSTEYSSSTQTSAGDFLKAIITISANAAQNDQSCIGPNSLTRQLVSEQCVDLLILSMLKGGNPLTVGVGIVIEVIRKNNSDYDPEIVSPDAPPTIHDPIYLGTLLRLFAKHIPDFMALVLSPRHAINEGRHYAHLDRQLFDSAWGTKIEPLGFDRFKTCELMAELLHCSNMGLMNEVGSDDYVRKRDQERQRLQAQGELSDFETSFNYTENTNEFGNELSPDLESSSPQGLGFSGEHLTDEEGFENVSSPLTLTHEGDSQGPDTEQSTTPPQAPKLGTSDDLVDEPLDADPPTSASESQDGASTHSQPEVSGAASPATDHLSKQVEGIDIGNKEADTINRNLHGQDTNVSESVAPQSSEEPSEGSSRPPSQSFTETGAIAVSELDVPEEKEKGSVQPENTASSTEQLPPASESAAEVEPKAEKTAIQIHGEEQIQTDIDGTPVVGDYLKIMFVENQVVPIILSFFFRFPWNNFLHNVVYDIVQQVFSGHMNRGYNRSLSIDVFNTGQITERIVEGQRRNDEIQATKNMRLGYMGHLTLVAEEVVKFTERHSPEILSRIVMDKVLHPDWIDYVERTLSDTRERDNAILGGVRPDLTLNHRQAVLSAINVAQGFSSAGYGGGSGSGYDNIDFVNQGSASGGISYSIGGFSGFGAGDEDEDMEDPDEAVQGTSIIEQHDPGTDDNDSTSSSSPSPSLNIGPSRASLQFAARLAQRQREADEAPRESDGNSQMPATDPFEVSEQTELEATGEHVQDAAQLTTATGARGRADSSSSSSDDDGIQMTESVRSQVRHPLEVDDDDDNGDVTIDGAENESDNEDENDDELDRLNDFVRPPDFEAKRRQQEQQEKQLELKPEPKPQPPPSPPAETMGVLRYFNPSRFLSRASGSDKKRWGGNSTSSSGSSSGSSKSGGDGVGGDDDDLVEITVGGGNLSGN